MATVAVFVAEIVAEAALSAAFDALFGQLSSQDLLKYARRNNVESEVNQWDKFLHEMKCVLDDAEERQMSEGPIKIWLDDLRDLAYDVEDILDEFSYEVLRQKVMAEAEASTSKVRKLIHTSCSCFSPRGIKFNVSLGSKMKEITQRFEAITKKKENLRLAKRPTGRSNGVVRERLETTSLVHKSQVYGREKDNETLVNKLLSSDSSGNLVSVVAIVGMGGLGKTTLAQLVYNEETFSRSFDIKAWVCVSDEFDVFKITVKILESFTSSSCDMKDLNNVQKKLIDVLRGKKFLLVLDDVWNENYLEWDALRQPLITAGGLGSKVLITTRSENVAATAGAGSKVHRLKKLELEECLSLLALHAFGVGTFSGQTSSLHQVGEQIAKKCDGLPLAAKALGGLLIGKSNPQEWQTVLNSNMWELPRDRCPVLPALRVSYHYLPSHLKRCFAFCAIFPKDYVFDKDNLILWWMAEGLLEQSKLVLSNFTLVGNEYFNDLLSRSFFQPSTGYYKGYKFVMHDLMNDLAMWVSEGTSLHLNTFEGSNYDMKIEKLRHLSFMKRLYEVAKRFDRFSTSMGLRTFMVLERGYFLSNVILERVIPNMRCLKLLCLRGYSIKELPQSIYELKHLRHLDMSFSKIRVLPESICGLVNLQILKLNGCWHLVQLPRKIRKLINLRVLDISETYQLKTMPPGIGHFKNLQILSKLIVGEKHELRLKELEELSLIRGELSIWGLEKVVDVQEAKDANLKAKEGLDELEFKWMKETIGVENEKQVQILDELQPHPTLRSLKIDGYNGKYFPNWVGDCRFTNLETLSLCGCKSASSLPPLGGMSSLKMLKIKGMHEVKKVETEFMRNTSNSNQTFPSLETLIIEEMNGLEEWCSCFGSGEEINVVFPQLRKMEIRDCRVLVGRLPNQLPLLEELSFSRCPNLRNLECRHPSLRKLIVKDCSERALKTLGDLTSLRSLRLENIRDFICMDDELLSMLGALKELMIVGCGELKSLVRNDKAIEGMVGLQDLTIQDCDEVVSFGPMRLPSSLKTMEIHNCKALKWLPEGFMMDGSSTSKSALEKFEIRNCPSFTIFPKGRFPNLLVKLKISACENLENMPELASSVKEMEIDNCKALKWLPEGFMMDGSNTCEPVLKKLKIQRCPSLTTFPRGRFPDLLVSLKIDGCDNLESMPKFSNSIKKLTITGCDRLQSLPRFPASVVSLEIGNLKSLALESTAIEKGMPISSNSENFQYQSSLLECIEIGNVEDVESESEKMFVDCSFSLEMLVITSLNWRRLPENITSFKGIKELVISGCENLRWLPKQMLELNCLQRLTIKECPNLELLAGQNLPRQLLYLWIISCEKVIEGLFAGGLSPLVSLTQLAISGGGRCVLDIKQEAPVFLPKLQSLWIDNFGNLENLAAAFQLPSSIEELTIIKCAKLRELPIHEFSSNLGSLCIAGCPLLKKRCLDRKGEYWPLLSMIPRVEIDEEDIYSIKVSTKRVGLFDACI